MGFGTDGGRGDFFQAVQIQGAGATTFHLLEVVAAAHVAHEQQAFQRFNVGAGGDHVHGDGDARIIGVPEIGQRRFGVVFGFVSHFFAEGIAFIKLFAHGLNNVVGVAVGFGENQGFRYFLAAGEDAGPVVFEGADHGADLIGIDHAVIQLFAAVGFVLVLLLPAFFAGELFAFLNLQFGRDFAARLGDLGFDFIHLVADIDTVGDGFFVGVFADHVFLEKTVSAVVRGGGEANQKGVEVIQHLLPQVVDRAVAFVDEDEVEKFQRQLGVVNHRHGLFGFGQQFCGIDVFQVAVEFFTFEYGIQALNGADTHLAVFGDVGRLQALHAIELGNLRLSSAGV